MNERIIKLANEANKDIGYTFKMEEAKQLHELMDKFAELIVKECAHVAVFKDSGTVATADVAGHMAAGRSIAAKLIKEHFGIEERKGWVCPKCGADRTKIACPLGFGASVDGRCPMTATAQTGSNDE